MKRLVFILWLFTLIAGMSLNAKMRVLSACIAEYPEESGWNALSADNDRELFSRIFHKAKTLDNSEATYSSIKQSLSNLAKETVTGDTVIIHFSGHGQQILTGTSSKEVDKVDEALVPYDAAKRLSNAYKGQAHFTDDLLGCYVAKIRKKAGAKGLVIAVIDACHSNSMNKDAGKSAYNYRGTDEIFGAETLSSDSIETLRKSYHAPDNSSLSTASNLANVIFISACDTDQRNYEIKVGDKHYGSLTYYFYETFREKGLSDVPTFLSTLYNEMSSNSIMRFHGQKPAIRNTIGWSAPVEPINIPPPPPPDNRLLYGVIGMLMLSILVFSLIWKKRKK